MKAVVILVFILGMLGSSTASADPVRLRLLHAVKKDFAAHVKKSGLSRYMVKGEVPINSLERKLKEVVDKKYDYPISNLEAKLLVRNPDHILRVKLVREISYDITSRICSDSEAEGNETDSARHFIAAFALSLLAGEKFAYQYLTAHEGWMFDQNLDEYTSYNFASGLMDLHNNAVGLMAARKYQTSIRVLNLEFDVPMHSLKKIKRQAIQALKQARKDNKLISVYAKDGACSQLSQREKLRSRVGLPLNTNIE